MAESGLAGLTKEEFQTAVLVYAHYLNIDLDREPYLVPIAEEALRNVPRGWELGVGEGEANGIPFFFNTKTGESVWKHPNEGLYIQKVKDEKVRRKRGKTDKHKSKKHSPQKTASTAIAVPEVRRKDDVQSFELEDIIDIDDDSHPIPAKDHRIKENDRQASSFGVRDLDFFDLQKERDRSKGTNTSKESGGESISSSILTVTESAATAEIPKSASSSSAWGRMVERDKAKRTSSTESEEHSRGPGTNNEKKIGMASSAVLGSGSGAGGPGGKRSAFASSSSSLVVTTRANAIITDEEKPERREKHADRQSRGDEKSSGDDQSRRRRRNNEQEAGLVDVSEGRDQEDGGADRRRDRVISPSRSKGAWDGAVTHSNASEREAGGVIGERDMVGDRGGRAMSAHRDVSEGVTRENAATLVRFDGDVLPSADNGFSRGEGRRSFSKDSGTARELDVDLATQVKVREAMRRTRVEVEEEWVERLRVLEKRHKEELDEARQEIVNLRKRHEEALRETEEAHKSLRRLRGEIEDDWTERLRAAEKRHKDELSAARDEVTSSRKRSDESQREAEAARKALAGSRNEGRSEAQNDVEAAVRARAEAEMTVRQVTDELRGLRLEFEALSSKYALASQASQVAAAEAEAAKLQAASAVIDGQTSNAALIQATQRIHQLDTDCGQLRAKVMLLEREKDTLDNELRRVQLTQGVTGERLSSAESDVRRAKILAQAEVSRLSSKVTELETIAAAQRQQLDGASLDQVQAYREAQRLLDRAEFDIKRLSDRVAEVTARADAEAARILSLEKELMQTQEMVFRRERQLKDERMRTEAANARCDELRNHFDSDMDKLKSEMQIAKAELLDSERKHRHELESIKKDVEERIPRIASSAAEKAEQLVTAQAEKDNEKLRAKYQKEIDRLQGEVYDLQSHKAMKEARLRAAVADEKVELDRLRSLCARLESHCADLEHELEDRTRELRRSQASTMGTPLVSFDGIRYAGYADPYPMYGTLPGRAPVPPPYYMPYAAENYENREQNIPPPPSSYPARWKAAATGSNTSDGAGSVNSSRQSRLRPQRDDSVHTQTRDAPEATEETAAHREQPAVPTQILSDHTVAALRDQLRLLRDQLTQSLDRSSPRLRGSDRKEDGNTVKPNQDSAIDALTPITSVIRRRPQAFGEDEVGIEGGTQSLEPSIQDAAAGLPPTQHTAEYPHRRRQALGASFSAPNTTQSSHGQRLGRRPRYEAQSHPESYDESEEYDDLLDRGDFDDTAQLSQEGDYRDADGGMISMVALSDTPIVLPHQFRPSPATRDREYEWYRRHTGAGKSQGHNRVQLLQDMRRSYEESFLNRSRTHTPTDGVAGSASMLWPMSRSSPVTGIASFPMRGVTEELEEVEENSFRENYWKVKYHR